MIDNLKPDDWFYTLPPLVRREIESLMQAGRKIEALKLFRLHTEAGLKESKDAIESWGDVKSFEDLPQGTRELLRKLVPGIENARSVRALGILSNGPTSSAARGKGPVVGWHDLSSEARTEIERLIPEGNYLEAIKVYRKHSHATLKDARDAVYAAATGMGMEPPRALASGIPCLLFALGFLAWMGLVAAMPFIAKFILVRTFGDRISPSMIEAGQALLPIIVVIVSVFTVVGLVVRKSGAR